LLLCCIALCVYNACSRMLMRGRARRFVPATPLGVVELLSRSGVSLAGKTAVVLGDSNIVGTPLAALLRDEGAALVTICHRPSIHE
jgi:5,10-methylene-tetrahydrofolate dehydrogenase/methenyl tetrahydrofolate cyclohydrolase